MRLNRKATSLVAMPRQPKLPEGSKYRVKGPGKYVFEYPLFGDWVAIAYLERRRDDYGKKEEGTGPFVWFWSADVFEKASADWLAEYPGEDEHARSEWFSRQPEPSMIPKSFLSIQSDGGWPTMEGAYQELLSELEEWKNTDVRKEYEAQMEVRRLRGEDAPERSAILLRHAIRLLATDLDEYVGSGMCYPFANKFIRTLPKGEDERAVLVHGTVRNKLLGRSFPHAWVELDGKVYDNAFPEGVDKATWRQYLVPSRMTKYTWKESIKNMLSSGHHGPWT